MELFNIPCGFYDSSIKRSCRTSQLYMLTMKLRMVKTFWTQIVWSLLNTSLLHLFLVSISWYIPNRIPLKYGCLHKIWIKIWSKMKLSLSMVAINKDSKSQPQFFKGCQNTLDFVRKWQHISHYLDVFQPCEVVYFSVSVIFQNHGLVSRCDSCV